MSFWRNVKVILKTRDRAVDPDLLQIYRINFTHRFTLCPYGNRHSAVFLFILRYLSCG